LAVSLPQPGAYGFDMSAFRTFAAIALAAFSVWHGPVSHGAAAQESAVLSREEVFHPVFAENGMVAAQEAKAARIGRAVLQKGGTAVDAAVAVSFALAVTLPRAGNLGGGGFMLVHDAAKSETVAIDYRETAPKAAGRDMYLDAAGKVDKKAKRGGYRSVAVPGTVAGLALAHEKYGKLPWADLVAPAIALAGDGFPVTHYLAEGLERRRKSLGQWAESRKIFFRDGAPLKPGMIFRQPDLARSLEAIAMEKHGGHVTRADLAAYKPVIRKPVRGTYRGYGIVSMPPPSSGGVHLIEMLNILEGYDLKALGPGSAAGLHLMIEAMRRAFADRSKHLGDPDHWAVPVAGLTSKSYAASLRKGIDPKRATPSSKIAPGVPPRPESPDTTHFTVMDKAGNVVSNTTTLNFSYGSRAVADETGILLNNEMDDFSAKPGAANAFGLIGGEANAIAPGKRPLSSMTPVIVFKDGKPWFATGAPGGSRIITTMLQIVVNVIDHGLNIAEATMQPRIHHQWLPDRVRIEKGVNPDTRRLLAEMGHMLKPGRAMGSVQSVMRTQDGFYGAADPRRPGALVAGY
jgi:gamma-glutamyltranspeptidase/glutathione hydrolase